MITLQKIKYKELAMLLMVSLMSLIANIPDRSFAQLVDRNALLVALAAFVVVAMFHYLKATLFIAILILAVGANLPHELGAALGISQAALLASLGLLVAVTLLNSRLDLLPLGIGNPKAHILEIAEARNALLAAISKGDLATLHKLIAMNVSVNFVQDGTTPIHLAAEKGYSDVVQILLNHGANFKLKNAEGKTPLEIALARKFGRTSEILFNASKPYFAELDEPVSAKSKTFERSIDAEDWRDQFHRNLRSSLITSR